MKKLITLMFVAVFGATALFANTELDMNIYLTPIHNMTAATRDNGVSAPVDITQDFAFGMEMQWGFFFAEPAKFLDVGIQFAYGWDWFKGSTYTNRTTGYSSHELGTGWGGLLGDVTFGPAIRFHLFDLNSFLLAPGLRLRTFTFLGEDTTNYIGITLGVDLDVGYRIWVANSNGFHFGFDVGVDLYWDFLGGVNDLDIRGGFGADIYLGMCFNFGDKAWNVH